MSLLAATTRTGFPGPSTSTLLRSSGPITQVRHAAQTSGWKKPGQDAEKEKNGKVPRPRVLKPMGANELKASIFQPERRNEKLELPPFSADSIGLGTQSTVAVSLPVEKGPAGAFGLPKCIKHEFSILSRPYCLVRDITLETCKILEEARGKPSSETRMVITGDQGSGKSYLLMQAVQYAKQKGWIVIYLPKSQKLVNSTSSYAYDIRTRTYVQPGASFALLKNMLRVNFEHFAQIRLKEPFVWEKITDNVHTPCPLVLERIPEYSTPVLLAIDEFQSLYGKTKYRDQHFVPIKSFHLSVPRALMEYANGTRKFRYGAVLGALTNTCTNFPIPLELRDALGTGYPHPTSPWENRSHPHAGQLTPQEAAGIFEVYMKDRVVTVANKDEFFLSIFVWKGLLNNLQY
ncbi:mitochondrial ribosomal death-associated protein 3-domain-containing protein [Cyathus striatus]|nr:mitochondrial ribosomal death-associated protein 3-domain-containing protein [Cyathus striatus]